MLPFKSSYFSKSMAKQRFLIMGHSFVHRLAAFVQKKRHLHAFFNLNTLADIHFHGVGGAQLRNFES